MTIILTLLIFYELHIHRVVFYGFLSMNMHNFGYNCVIEPKHTEKMSFY